MRENETILIADMCSSETATAARLSPRYITYDKNLPADAGIKVSDSGNTFKVSNFRFQLGK